MTHPHRSRPRVLHVLAAFDPKEGQGRCLHTIASLAAAEHHLICARVDGDTGGVFVDVTETGSPLWQFGWRDRDRIAKTVQTVQPDVIHFHGGPLGATTMASGWTARRPCVASIYFWPTVTRKSWGHGVGVGHLRRTPVLAPLSFANTIAPQTAIAALLRRAGVRVAMTPDRAVTEALAHHAIPVGTFEGITPPRPVTARRPQRGRFVFAGRAELTRGPDLLADAIRRLRADGRDVTAEFFFLPTHDANMVAGTTSAEGCTASIGGVDLATEMSTAVAVVLPFRFDTTTLSPALVATEALAGGVPVIGSNVRCVSAAVTDGHNGLLVPPGDVGALCRAIAHLDDHPDVASRLGDNAITETNRRWDHSSIIDIAEWAYMLALTRPARDRLTPMTAPSSHLRPASTATT